MHSLRAVAFLVAFAFTVSAHGVPLAQSNMANAPWSNAPWSNAPWSNSPWSNAPWSNAPWSNAPWSNSPWSNAPWSNAPIANVFFQNAPWSNAPWSNDNVGNTPWFEGALWNGPIENSPWSNAPWSNAPWSNAPWSNAPWSNAPWSNAPWSNAPFMRATIVDAVPSNMLGIVGATPESCPADRAVPDRLELGGYLYGTELVGFDGSKCVRGEGFYDTVFAIPRPDDPTRYHWFRVADVRAPVVAFDERGQFIGDKNLMDADPDNRNDDVWLYRVQAMTCKTKEEPCPQEDVGWANVCSADPEDTTVDAFGVFVKGFFLPDMTYVHGDTVTLACRRGTIAKALIDMGYKPYRSYTSRVTGQPVSGESLWITAAAALMAHYQQASTGRGVTRAGTQIDLRDSHGLVTAASETHSTFAAAAESTWAPGGSESYTQEEKGYAHVIFSARYPDLDSSSFNGYLNSTSFTSSNGQQFFTNNAGGAMPGMTSMAELIQIDSGVLCTHEPNVEGRALSPFCNACAAKVCDNDPSTPGWQDDLGCCRVSGDGAHDWLTESNTWSTACATRARERCSSADGLYNGAAGGNLAPARTQGTDVLNASFVEDAASPCVYVGEMTQGWTFTDDASQKILYTLEASPSFDILNPDAATLVSATFHQSLFDLEELKTFCVRPKANVSSTAAAPAQLNLVALDNGGQTKLLRVPLRFDVHEQNDAPTFAGWQTSVLSANEDVAIVNLGQAGATISAGPVGTFASTEATQTLTLTATLSNTSAGVLKKGTQVLNGSFAASELATIGFAPYANWNGSVTVTIRATDNGVSWNGSSLASDPKYSERSRTITINSVNDLPTQTTAGITTSLSFYAGATPTPALWTTKPVWTDIEDGASLTYRLLDVPTAAAKVLPATGTTGLTANATASCTIANTYGATKQAGCYTLADIQNLRLKANATAGSGRLRIEGRDSNGAAFIVLDATVTTQTPPVQ